MTRLAHRRERTVRQPVPGCSGRGVDPRHRVFALLAAPTLEAMPVASLDEVPCADDEDVCFELTLDGGVTAIHFDWDGQRHLLGSVTGSE